MRRSSFWSYESRLLVPLTTLAIPGRSTFDRVGGEDSVLHGRA